MRSTTACARLVALGLAMAGATTAFAARPPQPASAPVAGIAAASAERQARVGGVDISYRVSWSETVLKDTAGVPQATISATSYVRTGVPDGSARPVVFAFNGGPGASSSPLHFSLLGPRRWAEDAAGNRTIVNNDESLLDVADLVLVDPVGTGFSRELRPGGGKAYWSPAGDAKAVEALIRDWLRDHGRAASPVYIVGESYGGFRAARMARDVTDLNIAGLVLISPATSLSGSAGTGNDLPFVFELPTFAATAFAHRRVATEGRTVPQAWEEARAFAQGDYAVALQQGAALPPAERDALAARMSAMIGLPAAAIAAANLRVDSQSFLEQLLPGKVVGRVDTRVSAPKPEKELVPGRSKAADDPALGMGASNVRKSAAVGGYLRDEVGVKTGLDYISLTLDVNFAWNWNPGSPKFEDNGGFDATPNLATLMAKRPQARLLLLGGYYDLATPALGPRYTLLHAGLPLERVRMEMLATGHTPSEGDNGRRQVSAMLHEFIGGRR